MYGLTRLKAKRVLPNLTVIKLHLAAAPLLTMAASLLTLDELKIRQTYDHPSALRLAIVSHDIFYADIYFAPMDRADHLDPV